jgi:RNA polymerase sigma-70 factor (ECF subfamily)
MESEGSVTKCVHELKSPDLGRRDEAARIIFERFASRLKHLARRRLDSRIRRREDEQDIMQNAFASFIEGLVNGQTAPANRKELWKLLVRITMCKVVNTAKRHTADRRDVRRERVERHHDPNEGQLSEWVQECADRDTVSPHDRVVVVEEIHRLLNSLQDEKLRDILVWKFEGYTNSEISTMIGLTVRSVELKLQLIRGILNYEPEYARPASAGSRGGSRSNPAPHSPL